MRVGIVVLGLLAIAACSSTPDPEPTRSAPTEEAVAETAPSPTAEPETAPEPDLPERPSLAEVLAMAETSPRIRAAYLAAVRERGARRQAGLIPNPSLRLQANRIDVDAFEDGAHGYRVELKERIETAGKRGARTDVADERVLQTEEEARVATLAVSLRAATLHQRALASRLLQAARRAELDAAIALLEIETRRVERGRRPESTILDRRAEVGRLRVELAEETRRERTALRALEGVLAIPTGTFEGAAGEPLVEIDLPDPASPESRAAIAERNPELAALRASDRRARAETRQAQAGAWPDVTVGIDYEDAREKDRDRMYRLGLFVEVPLPVADRNQGAIAASRAEELRVQAGIEDAAARLGATYAEVHEAIAIRSETLATYRSEILPARERDYELAQAAHRAGRTDLGAVLESRIALARSLREIARIEEALAARHLEALVLLGRSPESWSP